MKKLILGTLAGLLAVATVGAFVAPAMLPATHISDPVFNYAGRKNASMHATVDDGEGQYKGASTRWVAAREGKHLAMGWGNGMPYVTANFTETKDNSSTVAVAAAGVALTAQASPSANDDTGIKLIRTWTLAQRTSAHRAMCRLDFDVSVSNLTDEGYQVWAATSSSTELFTADPADGVLFVKSVSANTYTIRVRQNSGTVKVATVTLPYTPAADTINQFSLIFEVGEATDGSDSIIEVWEDGVKATISGTDGLPALKQALYTMFATTPPTLTWGCSRRANGTTQRATTFRGFWGEVD